jgi:hypothetical protein
VPVAIPAAMKIKNSLIVCIFITIW